ncbi:MAG: DUF1851 domain-containing protein [Gammaproteobacteria bacterium]|nr:DUF1851 domain-containing protein [Gammaproteobacteria bacterium]
MKFEEHKIIEVINNSWGWKIPLVDQVLAVNSMGNCFLRDENKQYWRVCPEELSAELVAETDKQVQLIFEDPAFKQDWQLLGLIDPAEEHFGKLKVGQCYCMLIPAVLGGEYSITNLRVGSVYEYLSLTGELAFKTKELEDGDSIELVIDK